MYIAVLGGGLQGCAAALALAERGARVTIFDRNHALLTRAAVTNEGKIHLGYMYAGDPTLSTAKAMINGALAFAPFFNRHLGPSCTALATSLPAVYVVHRDSQQNSDSIARYLATVHNLIEEAAENRADCYFGAGLHVPPRAWSRAERDAVFNSDHVEAAFDTPEVAINPVELARSLRACIAAHPRIETALGSTVTGAEIETTGVRVVTADKSSRERFDHVVNALWDGRLALDFAAGLHTKGPWLHRLKYGVSFRLPATSVPPQSTTVVLGPFGEVVSYGGGLIYLTWYPECMNGISSGLIPPDWETHPAEPLRSRIITGTLRAISDIVPSLRELDPNSLPEASVKGGVIVARGETDIYDLGSELHHRYDIGVTSEGRFHSVDPGKLTMAPYFAEVLARRISGAE